MQKIIAIIFLLTSAATACTSAPFDQMKSATVLLFCQTGDQSSSGSGFIVGNGKHIVTNWHVVDCTAQGGTVFVSQGEGQLQPLKVIWSSERKDLAVLESTRRLSGSPVRFSTKSSVKEMDTVYAAGYPGLVRQLEVGYTVSIAHGRVGSVVVFTNGVEHYRVSAPLNPGNSGGPLFDARGNVIGINVAKPMTPVVGLQLEADDNISIVEHRVPEGEGVGWSILSDELLPELAALGIAGKTIGWGGRLSKQVDRHPGIFWALLALGLSAVFAATAALTTRGRQAAKRVVSEAKASVLLRRHKAPKEHATGVIRGISGEFAGQTIQLTRGELIMGTESRLCGLVFRQAAEGISKRHCIVGIDQTPGYFFLEDTWSEKGTFLASGRRLAPGSPCKMRPGDRFYLADIQNLFEIDMEFKP